MAKRWMDLPNETCGGTPRRWIEQVGEPAFDDLKVRAEYFLQ